MGGFLQIPADAEILVIVPISPIGPILNLTSRESVPIL